MNRLTKKITIVSAVVASSCLGLSGLAGAATMATITNTGQGSTNVVAGTTANTITGVNTNVVGLTNLSTQVALTGAVNLLANTNVSGGGAASGNAGNMNAAGLFVGITNGNALQGSLGLGGGTNTATINTTGQGSFNTIVNNLTNTWNQTNTNTVAAVNVSSQTATSGDVTVAANTNVSGGGATSGAAANQSTTQTGIQITNSSPVVAPASLSGTGSTATIANTGQGSVNTVTDTQTNTLTMTNDNTVTVTNLNDQTATSGDVTVVGNTNVSGGATSGAASNTSNTATGVQISN